MSDEDFDIPLARTVTIRGSLRVMMWLVVLMVLATVGLAIHRDFGPWIALVLGLAMIVTTERGWSASAAPRPIRLRGGSIELPSGLFRTRTKVVPIVALERFELWGRGPARRLVVESRAHAEVYPVSQLVGGEGAATRLRERVEAVLTRDAPEQLDRIRARAEMVDELRGRPIWVTLAVVSVIVVVFGAELFVFAGSPSRIEALVRMGGNVGGLVWAGEVWRLATANFVHAGFEHVIGNVAALMVLGSLVERVMGGTRFAGVLAVSAVGGTALAAWANPPELVSVGASTMVFGLLGCALALHVRLGWEVPVDLRVRPRRLWMVVGLQVVAHLLSPVVVDHWAHLGGFVGGAIGSGELLGVIRHGRRGDAIPLRSPPAD